MKQDSFDIKIITGKDIAHYLDILTQMRISLFKEYPYLYSGSFEYEQKYLEEYLKEDRATLAIVFDKNTVIATLTGIPLASDSSIIAELKYILQTQGKKPEDYYYYGEVLIDPDYRGKGLYLKMYKAIDELVKKWGYHYSCFLTVIRDENDPRKPKEYQNTDILAQKAGFQKADIRVSYSWPTIQVNGEVKDTDNELVMWVKKI